LDILVSIEERSSIEDECTCLLLISGSSIAFISSFLDFTTTEASKMKLSVLHKIFTDKNAIDDVKDIPTIVPSLQYQVLALNENIAWVKVEEFNFKKMGLKA
jgi:hypothetical protein